MEPALSLTVETWHSAGSKSASVRARSSPRELPPPQSEPPVTLQISAAILSWTVRPTPVAPMPSTTATTTTTMPRYSVAVAPESS
ncbi:hypothetical protein [Streptomyces sp. NPDC087437]|uniref:hypothetical protein n=1 Tax=Streptomyces sp. NPDC087437 TaxID=3365789 RepID=UPI0038178A34